MRLLFTSLAAAAAIATGGVAHAQIQKGDLWDITSQNGDAGHADVHAGQHPTGV